MTGPLGWETAYEHLQQLYYWPKIDQDVKEYVLSCNICQWTKADQQCPAGLLQPLEIPERPWNEISMDFVGPLPRTRHSHDALVVFIDRLTKMIILQLLPLRQLHLMWLEYFFRRLYDFMDCLQELYQIKMHSLLVDSGRQQCHCWEPN